MGTYGLELQIKEFINMMEKHLPTLQRKMVLFRANSTNSKAWFWGNEDLEERLIMDLDLEVGDSFDITSLNFYCGSGHSIAIVESVDSIAGRKRLRACLNFY